MLKRQTTGSVICTSCGVLVGVNDDRCYNCGRRNPGLWGFAPMLRSLGQDLGFVPFVIGTCCVVYVLTLIASGPDIRMGGMFSLFGPNTQSLFLFGASGALPVFRLGRWWTVLSAAWLHGGVLHILFNMLWIRQLAPATADLYGPGRMVIIYTAGTIVGFTLSSLAGEFFASAPIFFLRGGTFTVGASAPIFGLLGALVYYGRRTGGRIVGGEAFSYAVMLGLFGLLMPGVDNYAHAGGFAGGYVAALVLDPMKPERVDHVFIALVCLGLSLLSIIYSVFDGLRLFG
jgi:rhomboid protease GluP